MATSNVNKFDLIITIVTKGFSDFFVETARSAGASGATVINGRGVGVHENDSFFGVRLTPEKELVLILVFKQDKDKIMSQIATQARLDESGRGLCFSVPVNDVAGINYLIEKNKRVKQQQKQQRKSI